MSKKTTKKPDNVITQNRKARHNYEILDTYEAGIVLQGSEVKALREGRGNLDECYAVITGNEAFLLNCHIGEYSHAGAITHDPRQARKLLLHRSEINQLKLHREREGLTLVPLKMYWKKGNVKVLIGVAKGKKKHDKRHSQKEQDWQRSRRRMLKQSV